MRNRRYSPLRGLPVLEHDHAADRLGALEVRDVVALDAQRRAGQPERIGELLERGEGLALIGQPARLLPGEMLLGVARGEGHQLALLAALGHAQVDRAATTLGEERLDRLRLPDRRRDVDLARDGRRSGIELLEEAGEDLVVGGVLGSIEQVDVATDHLPVAQDEQHGRRLVVLPRQTDHVQVDLGEGGHLLALHRPLDGADLVAHRGRSLVLLALAGGLHLVAQGLDQRLLPPLEEQLDLLDVGPVVRLRDRLDARALTALDVIQQARPLERPLALLDVDRAGPEREQPPDQVHRLVDAHRRCVRTEVATAVGRQLAGPLDAREVVAQGDLDVRVALVVLEPDVEARLVALDEVRFEEQRLADAVDLGHLHVGDPVDDLADPMDVAGPADDLLLPVAPDPIAQALGLADVQDVAPGVLHQVHAGAVRESLERRFEGGSHPPMVCRRDGPCGRATCPWPWSPRRRGGRAGRCPPSGHRSWRSRCGTSPAAGRCRWPRSSGRRRR